MRNPHPSGARRQCMNAAPVHAGASELVASAVVEHF
jgi:hypothetical protein